MGLDMYLYKADKNGNYDWNKDEVGYWRKANHIHKWFVEHVQKNNDNCQDYEVTKEQVEKLLNTCKYVLESVELEDGEVVNGYTFDSNMNKMPITADGKIIKNPQVAKTMLPTTNGFFFGGTDYDEWYVNDLKDTVKILEKVLETIDFENQKLIYSSSW